MHQPDDQMPSKSSWPQHLGSSFPQSFFDQPQKICGLFQSNEFDGILNPQAGIHPIDDWAPSTDDIIQRPESSSSQSSGYTSSLDHGKTPSLQSNSRKMAALAPAQPKSPPSGEVQQLHSPRYHKRREQNRVAYALPCRMPLLSVSNVAANTKVMAFSQRAFRQRKEQHLKHLQDKVAALQATKDKINAENARLQQVLDKATVEKYLLQDLTKSSCPSDYADRSEDASILTPCRLDGDECVWLANPPPTSSFGHVGEWCTYA